jgi:MHS family alpha-ketoglutarate permease-like MFS transporter
LNNRLRSIAGGALGNLVEWFDWYAYSAFALYFSKSFFPDEDLTAQLLGTSAVFAIGFLMRPIGGLLLGLVADRHGRRTALALSVAMMCFGSLVIALVPGYATIGIAAPIILLIARMIQGLSVGGEYGVSAAYLSEIADPARRGFWSSFQYVTLIMGQLLALALLVFLQYVAIGEEALDAWGWRIPFVVGAVLAVVVFWIRRGIDETLDLLEEPSTERRASLRELLRHPRMILFVLGMSIGSNVGFYAYTTYMQKYLVASAGFDRGTASLICTAALVLFMAIQPLGGALSDRIGRKPLLYVFGVGGVLATVPVMTMLGRATDPVLAFLMVAGLLLIMTGSTSTSAITKAELFPPQIRALGIGLPYAVSQAIFGGTAEYIALWFKQAGHESLFFWYVTAAIGIALFTYGKLPETRWKSAIGGTSQG